MHMPDESTSLPAVTRSATVTLRPVTEDNLSAVMRLQTGPGQDQFVASNAVSMAQAAFSRHAWPRAIYADETPVGFVMLYDDPVTPEYFLWRLMIDHRYQRMGFARQAILQLIDYVCGRPNAKELLVSYVPGEGSPLPFYLGLGFVERGDEIDGERVMRLDLTGLTRPELAQPRPLTHIVLFKLQEPTPEVTQEVVRRLYALEGKIPELRSIEVGVDVVRSGRSYDVALTTRFDNLAAMQAYQVNPLHQEVLDYLRTVLAATVVVDYTKP
jgi:diamine N-acetyltransferase